MKRSQVAILGVGFLLGIGAVFFFGFAFEVTSGMRAAHEHVEEIIAPDTPQVVAFSLEEDITHAEAVERVATAFEWDEVRTAQFSETLLNIQWDAFNEHFDTVLTRELEWTEDERETFLINATELLHSDIGLLDGFFEPGMYQLESDDTPAFVAEAIIDRVRESETDLSQFVLLRLDEEKRAAIAEYLREASMLLPDLVPIPPQDVELRTENGRTLLVFTTIYYNDGPGALELRADPAHRGRIGDHERDVFQRIYHTDGTFTDEKSGTFFWHQPHQHYHFADFVEYVLASDDGDLEFTGDSLRQKSTFCIRDVSRVDIDMPLGEQPAAYRICGQERQGITAGWGDAYFHTYADQNLDVTNVPSGTYVLTFIVNPADRFTEVTKENNIANATITIDKEAGIATVVGTKPETVPAFEHIYIEN